MLEVCEDACATNNGERQRDYGHDNGEGAFEPPDFRVVRGGIGNGYGEALALRHEIGRRRHKRTRDGKKEQHQPQ